MPDLVSEIVHRLKCLNCPEIELLTRENITDILFKPNVLSARIVLIKWLFLQMSSKFNRILNDYLPTDEERLIENLQLIAVTLGICNMEQGEMLINATASYDDQCRFWLDLLELVEISTIKYDKNDEMNVKSSKIMDSFASMCCSVDKTVGKSMNLDGTHSHKLFNLKNAYNENMDIINYCDKLELILKKTKTLVDTENYKLKCTVVDFESEIKDSKTSNNNLTILPTNTSAKLDSDCKVMWDKIPVCEIVSISKKLINFINDFNSLIQHKFKPFLHRNIKNIDLNGNCVSLPNELIDNIYSNALKLSNFTDNLSSTSCHIQNIINIADDFESDIQMDNLPDDIIPKRLLDVLSQNKAISGECTGSLKHLFMYDDKIWDLGQN